MTKRDFGPLSYGECAKLAAAGRCDLGRKIAGNTWIRRDGDDYAVRLHSTDILRFHPDGSVTVDTRGWHTVTTWDRINRYIGDRGKVWNTKGEPGYWGPFLPGHGYPDAPHEFVDGMKIDPDGFPIYPGADA